MVSRRRRCNRLWVCGSFFVVGIACFVVARFNRTHRVFRPRGAFFIWRFGCHRRPAAGMVSKRQLCDAHDFAVLDLRVGWCKTHGFSCMFSIHRPWQNAGRIETVFRGCQFKIKCFDAVCSLARTRRVVQWFWKVSNYIRFFCVQAFCLSFFWCLVGSCNSRRLIYLCL